jgi:6-phosphofructokinase 1
VDQAARNLIDAGINILYVIGGDGGMQGTMRLAEALQHYPKGRDIAVVGIPKTMDNDIGWAWRSLGYRTALAEAARILDTLHADAKANRRVMLVELFGADAGFVTAGAAMASGKADLVLIREEPLDPWKTVAHIAKITRERGCALIVIAEGALSMLGRELVERNVIQAPRTPGSVLRDPWYERRDLHDAALKWLRDALRGEFMRPEVFTGHVVVNQPSYLIRAVPPSAEDIIYSERLGDLAVDNALAGYTGFMMTQWQMHFALVPLPLVVGVIRRVLTSGPFWREVVASTGQPSLA